MNNKRLPDPNKLAIRDIEKFETRTNNNVKNAIVMAGLTGLCLAFTSVFAVLGLDSVSRNQYVGKSLGYGALALLSASGMLFSGLKTTKLYSRTEKQHEIFKDMATNQFEQELQKKLK